MQDDGKPSPTGLALFPTISQALRHVGAHADLRGRARRHHDPHRRPRPAADAARPARGGVRGDGEPAAAADGPRRPIGPAGGRRPRPVRGARGAPARAPAGSGDEEAGREEEAHAEEEEGRPGDGADEGCHEVSGRHHQPPPRAPGRAVPEARHASRVSRDARHATRRPAPSRPVRRRRRAVGAVAVLAAATLGLAGLRSGQAYATPPATEICPADAVQARAVDGLLQFTRWLARGRRPGVRGRGGLAHGPGRRRLAGRRRDLVPRGGRRPAAGDGLGRRPVGERLPGSPCTGPRPRRAGWTPPARRRRSSSGTPAAPASRGASPSRAPRSAPAPAPPTAPDAPAGTARTTATTPPRAGPTSRSTAWASSGSR